MSESEKIYNKYKTNYKTEDDKFTSEKMVNSAKEYIKKESSVKDKLYD